MAPRLAVVSAQVVRQYAHAAWTWHAHGVLRLLLIPHIFSV